MLTYSLTFLLLLGAQQATCTPVNRGDSTNQNTQTNEFVEEVKKSIPHWPMSVKAKYVSVIPDQLPNSGLDAEEPEKNQLIQTRSTKTLPAASPDLDTADYSIPYNRGKTISSDPNDSRFKFPELPQADDSTVQEFGAHNDEKEALMPRALGTAPLMTEFENSINDLPPVRETTNSIETDGQMRDPFDNLSDPQRVIAASLIPTKPMQTNFITNDASSADIQMSGNEKTYSEKVPNVMNPREVSSANAQSSLTVNPQLPQTVETALNKAQMLTNSIEVPTDMKTAKENSPGNTQTGLDANKQTGLSTDPNPSLNSGDLGEAQKVPTAAQSGLSAENKLPETAQAGLSKEQQLPNGAQTGSGPNSRLDKVPNAGTVQVEPSMGVPVIQNAATQTVSGSNPNLPAKAQSSSGDKPSNVKTVQVEPAVGTVLEAGTQTGSGTSPSNPDATQNNGDSTLNIPSTGNVMETTTGVPAAQDTNAQAETGFTNSGFPDPFSENVGDDDDEDPSSFLPPPALLQRIFRLAGITNTPGRCAFIIIRRKPIGSFQIPSSESQVQQPIFPPRNFFEAFRPASSSQFLPARFLAPPSPSSDSFNPLPFQSGYYPSQQPNLLNPLSFLFSK